MARERLFIVHGTGPDRVGLVGTITTAIARAGGNVVDLRQDVLHGLFTVFMVVDLSRTELRVAELTKMVKDIAEDTGLDLRVDTYTPVARPPRKKNLLVILIGHDKPGIVAQITETLAKYRINIELSQMVAREDVFLMELLTDVEHCTLPISNACDVITKAMAPMGITSIFQTDDVFNKKKRVVLFDTHASFIGKAALGEILQQTGITREQMRQAYSGDTAACLRSAASSLEGFPADILEKVALALRPTAGTMELVQTLRIMGYSIALASPAFTPLLGVLRRALDIDHAFGVGLGIDDDSRAVTGDVAADDASGPDTKRVLAALAQAEGAAREDITVVADAADAETPGIRLDMDMGVLLELFNKRSISKGAMIGILGAMGTPRL